MKLHHGDLHGQRAVFGHQWSGATGGRRRGKSHSLRQEIPGIDLQTADQHLETRLGPAMYGNRQGQIRLRLTFEGVKELGALPTTILPAQ